MKNLSILKPTRNYNLKKRLPFLFVAAFAVIGVVLLVDTTAAPKNLSPAVTMSMSPASLRLNRGETLSIAIKVNTNFKTVNAVQSNFSYPMDKFEFISIDPTGSAFEIDAQSIGGDGVIKIARGTITPFNSQDALVATVNLRTIGTGRKVNLKFTEGTALVDVPDSNNILERLSGGSYTIQ